MASVSKHNVIIRIVNQASKALDKINGDITRMLSKIDDHREGIQAVGAVAGVAFAGLGFGVKNAVSTFADFEEKMSGVKAVLNPTQEEMEALTTQAEKLGASTKFSALETAEATEVLAKNGLNATQILGGALESTLALAAATGTDIATAADIATDAMASFGLQTEDLGQVMNSITGVTNASKFAIEDYKYALAAGGGVASALGVELEDFNTVIAATSSRFAGGSDAGTSFKTFMQRLVPQSKEATKEMIKLGLATKDGKSLFYDASGKLKDMAEVSELLKNATKDLSEEQKNASLSVIFGSDALRTAMGLAEVGAEKFGELQKSIEATDASANAKTRMDNLKGTFEELGGAVDSVKIALGRSLAPVIKQVTIWVTELAQKIGVWAAENPELASTIITIATAVTGLIAGASGLSLALGPIISGIKLVGAVIGGLMSPIGLVVAAISAFAYAYTTNFLGFRDLVNKVVEFFAGVPAKISEIIEKIKGYFEDLKNKIAEKFDVVKNFLTDFVVKISEKFSEVMGKITELKQWFFDKFSEIQGILEEFWENFGESIQVAVGAIVGLFIPSLVKTGIAIGKLAITTTVETAKMVASWLLLKSKAVATSTIITIKSIPSLIAGLVKLAIQTGVELAKTTTHWVVMGAKKMAVATMIIVQAIGGMITSLVKFTLTTAVQTGKIIASWVLMGSKALIAGAKMATAWVTAMGPIAWVTAAIVAIGVLIYQNWEKIVENTKKAWQIFVETIVGAWNTITDFCKKLGEKIIGMISDVWKIIKETTIFLWEEIIKFFVEVWDRLLQMVQGFGNFFANLWRGIWEGIKKIAGMAWEGIKGIVINIAGAINEWIKNVFGVDLGVVFLTIWNKAKDIASGAMVTLSNLVRPILETLVGWVEGLIGGIQRAWDKAKEVGEWVGKKGSDWNNYWKDVGNNVYTAIHGGVDGNLASGGPVSAGSRYMVGERGPELFVPATNGYIVPNNQLGQNATININMGGVVVQNEADENRLVQKISQKLQKEAKLYKLGIV